MTPLTTPLDHAHAAMRTGAQAAALQFYRVLADVTLFVVLEHEAVGEQLVPKVFDLPDGPVLLAYDSEDRMSALGQDGGQGPLAYAALPGRIVAQQMLQTGLSLGLNFGTDAASETLLPPEALIWLCDMLAAKPAEVQATPVQFSKPVGLPAALGDALRLAFAGAAGMAQAALLVGVRYLDGRRGHMLAIIGAASSAEPALARAMAEALAFSGIEAGELDVTFLGQSDPVLGQIAAVADIFDVPDLTATTTSADPTPPTRDPNRPPVLR